MTVEADKWYYDEVFKIGKQMAITTSTNFDVVMADIPTSADIDAIINDFEHGKAHSKIKLENIVKSTTAFKSLLEVEAKIKSSKEKLTSLVAACMWNAGEHKGNFSKEHFVRLLLKEKEKKEKKEKEEKKDVEMRG